MGLSLSVNASPFYEINADSKSWKVARSLEITLSQQPAGLLYPVFTGFSEYEP